MNITAYTYRIQSFLEAAKKILIIVKNEPDVDCLASGLALYLSLSQRGKQVTIACPSKMTVAQSDLFAVDKITDELGSEGKNMVISFPYTEGSIEKVSYNIENNRFNLVIEPRKVENLPQQENIEFSRGGESANNFDLVFVLGGANYFLLGKFEAFAQKLFQGKPVVVVDLVSGDVQFGTVQVISQANSSVSEIITLLLAKLNLPLDRDIANNLLKGIKNKTNNYTHASADSFEATAICLRKSGTETAFNQVNKPLSQSFKSEDKKTPPDWLKPKIFRSSSSANLVSGNNNKGSIL